MGKNFLGEFEETILIAVMLLGENDAYGVPIAERAEAISGKRVSIGALYTSLGRLEEKGYLRSWVGESTEERGGRAKKYYAVEGAGEQVIRDIHESREAALRAARIAGGWNPSPAYGV